MRSICAYAAMVLAACESGCRMPAGDAGAPARIGAACTLRLGDVCGRDPGTCSDPTGICIAPICDASFRGGYCSKLCGSDNPTDPSCPPAATCVAFGLRNQFL